MPGIFLGVVSTAEEGKVGRVEERMFTKAYPVLIEMNLERISLRIWRHMPMRLIYFIRRKTCTKAKLVKDGD